MVVLITNLTPGEFEGVFSSGLVLCASDSTHEKVEVRVPTLLHFLFLFNEFKVIINNNIIINTLTIGFDSS